MQIQGYMYASRTIDFFSTKYLLYTKSKIRMFNRATILNHIILIILTVRFKTYGSDLTRD
jgi:hypothetical protein